MAILIAEATSNGLFEALIKNIRAEELKLQDREPLNRKERRALKAINKKLQKQKSRASV